MLPLKYVSIIYVRITSDMVAAICICNMAQMVHPTVGTIGSANAQ